MLLGALGREFQRRGGMEWRVTCVSPAALEPKLTSTVEADLGGARCVCVDPNDGTAATKAIEDALHAGGDDDDDDDDGVVRIAVFDRYHSEEMFGWRVRETSPGALRVLDTQDIHCLRRARERAAREEGPFLTDATLALDGFADRETAAREVAAAHRSDVTIVVSDAERDLMARYFKIDANKLVVGGFFYRDDDDVAQSTDFRDRRHFVFIGSFLHSPNVDAVNVLKSVVWPRLAPRVNDELHVLGSEPRPHHRALDDPPGRFRVLGPVQDQYAALRQYRVLLAPLRFGAGVKGKIADAWRSRTAVVTTSIGLEGMLPGTQSPAHSHSDDLPGAFVDLARRLYEDPIQWRASVRAGAAALRASYDADTSGPAFASAILEAWATLDARRQRDWTGTVLWSQAYRASEFMSRWIQAKQSKQSKQRAAAGVEKKE